MEMQKHMNTYDNDKTAEHYKNMTLMNIMRILKHDKLRNNETTRNGKTYKKMMNTDENGEDDDTDMMKNENDENG